MLAQVLAVFLWNLLWLSRVKNRKAQIFGNQCGKPSVCLVSSDACSCCYIRSVDCSFNLSGKMAERVADGRPEKDAGSDQERMGSIHWAETLALGLVTGSALWMVIVCVISLTGHGGSSLLADSGPDPYLREHWRYVRQSNQEKNESRKQQERKSGSEQRGLPGGLCFRIPSTGSFMGVYPYHGSLQAGRLNVEAGL